jgi:hypothetical protein
LVCRQALLWRRLLMKKRRPGKKYMTYNEFIQEYLKIGNRTLKLSEIARAQGLLSIKKMINQEKMKQRDILEYGLQLMADGTTASTIDKILSNIIRQEDDKNTRKIMHIKKEALFLIQDLSEPGDIVSVLNSLTDLALIDDPLMKKYYFFINEYFETGGGTLTPEEIDMLLKDVDDKMYHA